MECIKLLPNCAKRQPKTTTRRGADYQQLFTPAGYEVPVPGMKVKEEDITATEEYHVLLAIDLSALGAIADYLRRFSAESKAFFSRAQLKADPGSCLHSSPFRPFCT